MGTDSGEGQIRRGGPGVREKGEVSREKEKRRGEGEKEGE